MAPEESVMLDTHEYKEQEAQVAVPQTSALNPVAQWHMTRILFAKEYPVES